MKKLPIYRPSIGQREKELVMDCLETSWISSLGKYVGIFEQKLAANSGVAHAISMHNGTHPLHIACLLSGVDEDSEVIVPALSYVATANAVAYCGAKPVFVDVSTKDWNIDVSKIEERITPKTKAIVAVDIYGCPADYRSLKEIANRHSLKLIADAAESIGATYHGKPSGSLGDFSTFSFFGNKTLTTGEGGALLTNNSALALKAQQLKNQGNSDTKRYFHDVLGYNYRMTNIQAAIGLGQLERLEEIIARKKQIYDLYRSLLGEYVTFQEIKEGVVSSHWLVSFRLPSNVDRNELSLALEARGIETRPFFVSMDKLPYFEDGDFTVSHDLSERGMSVPSFPLLLDEEVEFICQSIVDLI